MKEAVLIYALPLLLVVGCANLPPPPDDSWMVCIDTREALECVVSDDGEKRLIKVPHVEKDGGA